MRYSRVKTMMLLTAFSLLAGACTSGSSIDRAYGEASGSVFAGQGYNRSIFSSHNF